MKRILLTGLLTALLLPRLSRAQMPHDAIYMPKKSVCIAGIYGHSSWNQYWENTLKRENLNICTHTTQSVMLMPALGISNRVNVILSLPYVWTSTSATASGIKSKRHCQAKIPPRWIVSHAAITAAASSRPTADWAFS